MRSTDSPEMVKEKAGSFTIRLEPIRNETIHLEEIRNEPIHNEAIALDPIPQLEIRNEEIRNDPIAPIVVNPLGENSPSSEAGANAAVPRR